MRMTLGQRRYVPVKPERCKECVELWTRQRPFKLYTPQRLSYVSLEIEDADILVLFYALIERCSTHEALEVCAETLTRLAAACKRKKIAAAAREATEKGLRNAGYSDDAIANLGRSVEELELSARSYKCLRYANIQTVRELAQKSQDEMLSIENFGKKSLDEIKEILASMSLSFGMPV